MVTDPFPVSPQKSRIFGHKRDIIQQCRTTD